MKDNTPWQLRMFQKTLKKKLKLKRLRTHIEPLNKDDSCLLITCGENNGALNHHLRAIGGRWTWAELEENNIQEIEELLGEPVVKLDKSTCNLPFPDISFDYVLAVDCHEHLVDPHPFNLELARVTKPGGRVVVSVPNGDENKLAVRIKRLLGMTEKVYGHVVLGYDIPALRTMMERSNLKLCSGSSYSKFFSEILELCINFAYVKILSRKSSTQGEEGTIVPTTKEQLKSVSKTYKIYSLVYPIFWTISQLDALLFFTTGYAVVVEARKEA